MIVPVIESTVRSSVGLMPQWRMSSCIFGNFLRLSDCVCHKFTAVLYMFDSVVTRQFVMDDHLLVSDDIRLVAVVVDQRG